VFGGLKLINIESGGIFVFALIFPTTLGWIVMVVWLAAFGAISGLIYDVFRNDSQFKKIRYIKIALIGIFICWCLYLIAGSTARSFDRCDLVFDGEYNQNRSECYLEAMTYDKQLRNSALTVEYCESYTPILENEDGNATYYYSKCVAKIAELQKQSDICNLIPRTNSGIKLDCLKDFLKKSEGASICSQISESETRNKCYLNAYREYRDYSICDEISPGESKDLCLSYVAFDTEDETYCESVVAEQQKIDCYRYLVEKNHVISICDNISDEPYRNMCRDSVYYENDFFAISLPRDYRINNEPVETQKQLCPVELVVRKTNAVKAKIQICASDYEYEDGYFFDQKETDIVELSRFMVSGSYTYSMSPNGERLVYEKPISDQVLKIIYDPAKTDDPISISERKEFEDIIRSIEFKGYFN
ncbi:hypothetical protein KC845_03485, partial [Candidatus Kaiserbacteria bacterium]|nr:hypothetical protein [Candidatus Kaiserbacteria bacterium]